MTCYVPTPISKTLILEIPEYSEDLPPKLNLEIHHSEVDRPKSLEQSKGIQT